MKSHFLTFRYGDASWRCGENTRIMGVINVTPDSFSDGGTFFDPSDAVEQGMQLAASGADCLDVGGESTRPGADPVEAEEEKRRTVPVVRGLVEAANIPVSIDTTKAAVAEAAIDAGATIINDVSAFRADKRMIEVLRTSQAGAIAMHMRGTPKTMQQMTAYDDLVGEVLERFQSTLRWFEEIGIDPERLMFDPGIGFGKTVEQNLELIAATPRFRDLGRPILLGPSRKSFIGRLLGVESPDQRVWGTVGVCACGAMLGADVLRVHDVAEVRQAVVLADAVAEHTTAQAAAG